MGWIFGCGWDEGVLYLAVDVYVSVRFLSRMFVLMLCRMGVILIGIWENVVHCIVGFGGVLLRMLLADLDVTSG